MLSRFVVLGWVFTLLMTTVFVPEPAHAQCYLARHDGLLSAACLEARVEQGLATSEERRDLDRRLRQRGLEGLGLAQEVPRTHSRFRVRPVLRGSQDTQSGEESGLEAGLGASWSGRAVIGPGHAARMRVEASEAIEPRSADRRARRALLTCGTHSFEPTRQVELCNRRSSSLKRGDTDHANSLRLTYAHGQSFSPTHQAVYRIGLIRFDDLDEEFTQPRLRLGYDTIEQNRHAWGVGLTLGAPVDEQEVLRWRVDTRYNWGVFQTRAYVFEEAGNDLSSLGLGATLGFDRVSRWDVRVGFRAREDSESGDWNVNPVLGFDLDF